MFALEATEMRNRGCETGFTMADRRSVGRLRRGIGAALLVYMLLNALLQRHLLTGGWESATAALTGADFFLMFVLFGLMAARSGDEFRRALLLKSLLWGLMGTMLFIFVWGFVEVFSREPVMHVPILFVPALLIVTTAAAKLLVFRRHTVSVDEPAA